MGRGPTECVRRTQSGEGAEPGLRCENCGRGSAGGVDDAQRHSGREYAKMRERDKSRARRLRFRHA